MGRSGVTATSGTLGRVAARLRAGADALQLAEQSAEVVTILRY